MRGHEQIIAMRMNRTAPKIVFVNDYPCKTDWAEHGEHATVCTAGKPLGSLDMRFLTGLTVSISATSEQRAKALFSKVKQAGAKVVGAIHVQPGVRDWEQTGWMEVSHG